MSGAARTALSKLIFMAPSPLLLRPLRDAFRAREKYARIFLATMQNRKANWFAMPLGTEPWWSSTRWGIALRKVGAGGFMG
jgi:hypothetical protein